MSALTAGQYLDSRFRLIRPLGEGGTADIWLADDVDLGEQVVVAIVPEGLSTDRIGQLRHAAASPTFDFHRGSGFSYITTAPTGGAAAAGSRAAAIVEQLRLNRSDAAGEGDDRPASPAAAADTRTTRPVRLTPPPRAEPIRPITPRLSRTGEKRTPPAGRRRGLVPAIAVALAAIITGLFVFLPRDEPPVDRPETQPDESAPTTQSGAISPAAGDTGSPDGRAAPLDDLRRRAYLKDQAEEAARRARDLGTSLQERGATLWGDDRLATALQRIADGDARLAEGTFDAAGRLYGEAIETLQAVDAGSLDLLRTLLADGQSALVAGDAIAAAAAFSLAARIDPSSKTAASGLRRAEVLDELTALLDDGARRERLGDMAAAERIYDRAVALDPLSEAARGARARVKARIGDDAYAAAITAGLAALDRNDYQAARAAFRRAGALRPDSRQVGEGLMRTDEGEKLQAIAAHRDRAVEMEEAERWRAAEKEYDAILRLDPAIRMANVGLERARERAELSEALAYHLDHPDRLAADDVFEEASRLQARAAAVAPAGPQLRGQIEALDALLARMRDTVRVVLESDERTEVTIYRVGRLGTFSRHEVELRPGTYTVVGTRRGYRDVRHQLVIVPGKEPDILVVRCEEKI